GASVQNEPTYGRVLNLNGTNQYVRLPPGTAYARTFSAVVKWNGGGDWQRIFDFGVDTSRYVMLTPSGVGKLRCDIRANGVTQSVIGPAALPVGVWTQVAVTLNGQTGILYLNGNQVATGPVTLSPLDVLAQTNHLGHSKFAADPDFNGRIASFRVWGRALSAAELTAPQPSIAQPADGATYWPGTTVSFSGSAKTFADIPLGAGALSWRVEYVQDGRTNSVYGPVTGVTNGSFIIPTNATGGGSYRVILTANDGAGHQSTAAANLAPANPPAEVSSYYPFRNNASDANGHFNGMLNGGASIQFDPTRGNVHGSAAVQHAVEMPVGIAGIVAKWIIRRNFRRRVGRSQVRGGCRLVARSVVRRKNHPVAATAGCVGRNDERPIGNAGDRSIHRIGPAILDIFDPPTQSARAERDIGERFCAAAERNRRAGPISRAVGRLGNAGLRSRQFGGRQGAPPHAETGDPPVEIRIRS